MGNHLRSPKLPPRRRYNLKARADKQAETHRALARAASELHHTVGPSRTTISAIADRAGVQRLTVYRHFPDEEAIFSACTAYSFEVDPPPNPDTWIDIDDPEERHRIALEQLYGYYRRKRQLLANLYRDAEMPVVAAALERRRWMLRGAGEILSAGWKVSPAELRFFGATLAHTLQFATWLSLAEEQGLSDAEAIELAVRIVNAAARHAGV
ncbi:TetR/AcrR family transcriptional regulator [Mesorhizobium sp.]|uniref:TetR/AcrR family transcriptional regulator n=1 Tax=Mesorhizobium sp. TaxID=1871066 RepID=UPI0025F61DF4|nr:TetR/AcrR family transcriptional regulator [Mesorhizobium sp.]